MNISHIEHKKNEIIITYSTKNSVKSEKHIVLKDKDLKEILQSVFNLQDINAVQISHMQYLAGTKKLPKQKK